MKITIERVDGKLKRQVWEASLFVDHHRDPLIVITFWGDQERPTSRHKWRSLKSWAMHATRSNPNAVAEPPLPEDVVEELRSQASQAILAAPISLRYR